MTELYIEGNYVELSEEILYSINKTYEDLSDPTKIKNDFSKTIQIPLTKNNFELFGRYSSSQYIPVQNVDGLSFDPNSKLKFTIYDNGVLIFRGYVKFTTCYYSVDAKYIECTLNSTINSIFNDLNSLTLSTKVDDMFNVNQDSDNTVADLLFNNKYKTIIDKNYIINCWNNTFDYYNSRNVSADGNNTLITKKVNELYKRSLNIKKSIDVIGFAFTNRGLYDNFDSSIETLGGLDINESTVFKNTIEMRSYYQRPYVYVSAFFEFLKTICNAKGIKLFLDPIFFNKYNPYYADLVYVTKLLDLNTSEYTNIYDFPTGSTQFIYEKNIPSIANTSFGTPPYFHINAESKNSNPISDDISTDESGNIIYLTNGNYNSINNTFKCTIDIDLKVHLQGDDTKYFKFETGRGYLLYIIDDKGNTISNTVEVVCREDSNDFFEYKSGTKYLTKNYKGKIGPVGGVTTLPLIKNKEVTFTIYQTNDSSTFRLKVQPLTTTIRYSRDNYVSDCPLNFYSSSSAKRPYAGAISSRLKMRFSIFTLTRVFTENKRSESFLTLDRVLGSDFKISNFIINYCKLFNLKIIDNDETLSIFTTNRYFRDSKVKEVSDKIDRSVWSLNPNRFENKFVSFDYDEKSTFISDKYKDLYGINYGSKIIDTNYKFNSETQNLLKNYNIPIENVQNYIIINNDNSVSYSSMSTSLPSLYTVDGDNFKDVNDYNSLYFLKFKYLDDGSKCPLNFYELYNNNGLMAFVTDDTADQTINNKYKWSFDNKKIAYNFVTLSAFYETFDGAKYSVLFEKPNTAYMNKVPTYYDDVKFIYDIFWENYLNDRYFGNDLTDNVAGSSQVLKTKMFLNNIQSLPFKDVYIIDGSYWLLNKITDYNPNSSGSTNVEFVKVQNINNYKQKLLQKDNYNYYYTPNDYYEFSSKEHYFEVNIYTDYISYTVTQDSDNITYVDSSKNGDCITFIFKISENTSSNKIESHILFSGNIITTIVQNEDSVDSVDFYASQYTAILKGANSDNSTDNVLLTSTNFNNVEITSVPDNLKCELKPVIPFKINRNKRQIVITNSKNVNSKNYIIFNYVDKDNISHPILRSILFKVIVKKLRKIKKPMVTIPNNQIKKPVITIPKNPNISI